jgi:hypothetical protein
MLHYHLLHPAPWQIRFASADFFRYTFTYTKERLHLNRCIQQRAYAAASRIQPSLPLAIQSFHSRKTLHGRVARTGIKDLQAAYIFTLHGNRDHTMLDI